MCNHIPFLAYLYYMITIGMQDNWLVTSLPPPCFSTAKTITPFPLCEKFSYHKIVWYQIFEMAIGDIYHCMDSLDQSYALPWVINSLLKLKSVQLFKIHRWNPALLTLPFYGEIWQNKNRGSNIAVVRLSRESEILAMWF